MVKTTESILNGPALSDDRLGRLDVTEPLGIETVVFRETNCTEMITKRPTETFREINIVDCVQGYRLRCNQNT